MVERDRRRKELGLGPHNKYLPAAPHGPKDDDAAAAAESSTSEGSSGDPNESDDDDIWWRQTWYGGTILRDGASDGSASPGTRPAGQFEDSEASLTESPAAVAAQQRRSVPRMPLCEKPASIPCHREKERFDMQYF